MASENVRLNSLFAFMAKVGGAGASLLTTMMLARLLPKEEFAGFVMAYTVVMLGGMLGGLGMGNAILRYAGFFLGAGQGASARDVTRRCVWLGQASLLIVAMTLFFASLETTALADAIVAFFVAPGLRCYWLCSSWGSVPI